MGAVGLIALARSDEVGLVYGDGRGAVSIRSRRGEAHIESLLERYYTHGTDSPSDIGTQLAHVARAHRSRLLVIVVSDEPDVTPALEQALQRLSGRHEVLWLLTPTCRRWVATTSATDSTSPPGVSSSAQPPWAHGWPKPTAPPKSAARST